MKAAAGTGMMARMMARTLPLAFIVTLSTLLTGCFNNTDTICEKRKECFSDTLHVSTCMNELSDWAEARDTNRRREQLARCADCLDSRTCSQIRTACIAACNGVP